MIFKDQDGMELKIGDVIIGTGFSIPYTIVGPISQLIEDKGVINVATIISKINPDNTVNFEAFQESGVPTNFRLVYRAGWIKRKREVFEWEQINKI